jgi:hypothetical protein
MRRSLQPALGSPGEPILELTERAASNEGQTQAVRLSPTSVRLGDIRPDGVSCTNQLYPDGSLVERRPLPHAECDLVGELARLPIRGEIPEPLTLHTYEEASDGAHAPPRIED